MLMCCLLAGCKRVVSIGGSARCGGSVGSFEFSRAACPGCSAGCFAGVVEVQDTSNTLLYILKCGPLPWQLEVQLLLRTNIMVPTVGSEPATNNQLNETMVLKIRERQREK